MSKFQFKKSGEFLFRWVAPLVVLGCAAWFVYAMGAQEKPRRKKPPVRKSVSVEVVNAKIHSGTLDLVSRGVVIPHREVNLSARVAGEVVFKSDLLSPGRFVNKDDLLLKIDQTDYKLEVARLKQELVKVDADLDRIKVDKANAQRLLKINRDIAGLRKADDKRISRLRAANAATDTEVDAAQLAVLSAYEKITTTENQLRGLESQAKSLVATRQLATIQLQRANLDLSRTEIYAPFSGVVIQNQVEQNSNIAIGTMVATIEDTSMAEVRCNLRSDEMDFIYDAALSDSSANAGSGTSNTKIARGAKVNQSSADAYRLPSIPVTIEYEQAGQQFQWSGVLSRQDGLGVDQNTRMMPVRILVAKPTQSTLVAKGDSKAGMLGANGNPAGGKAASPNESSRALALVRGMFVRVKLHCQPKAPMLVLPESVLRPGKKVWVMRDKKLCIEPIRTIRIENGNAYFDPRQSKLSQTDQVISSPVPNAKPGLDVSLKSDRKKKSSGKQSPESDSPKQDSMQDMQGGKVDAPQKGGLKQRTSANQSGTNVVNPLTKTQVAMS